MSAAGALIATYRVQLGPDVGFGRVAALVPYLRDLGVSHLYLSPVLQARHGSTHGYDVTDPTRVSEALGGEDGLRGLAGAGLALVVDVVPNHMAAVDENPFWRDPARRARFFDLDPATGRHRRFFDVDELAGVRVEDPEVFAVTHGTLLRLVADGVIAGLRVDHVDGLADPAGYLARLRAAGVRHVWVEKILEPGERLRDWPVCGTTGYEFLNDTEALLVDPRGEATLTTLGGCTQPFADLADAAKREQVATTFTPEVERLRAIGGVDDALAAVLPDALAALPVYRTYVNPVDGVVSSDDRAALAHLPTIAREALTLERHVPAELVVRFQQTTGAVTAKGVEDTALYRHVRLLALNEVGGDPDRFGIDVAAFHRANRERLAHVPDNLLASTTHDTKRSGDVRARIGALSQVADEWADLVGRWRAVNARFRRDGAPDADEELFVYQTLAGAWPISDDRVERYLRKALREAKRRTSWTAPDELWEARVIGFAQRAMHADAFLAEFVPFVERLAIAGERSSLVQLTLRVTAPGVPDVYQGDELWNLALVDPDNRRPVDWAHRRDALDRLSGGSAPTRADAKLFALRALLALRRRRPEAFHGTYTAVDAGPGVCAYRRGDDVLVVVPTRPTVPRVDVPRGWVDVLAPLAPLYDQPPAVYEPA